MMTLSGNIESFPLSEVMRLAARSSQSGLLRVESGGTHGRVYFQEGFLTYATTRDQDDLGGDLSQLGMIDPHKWYDVERGEAPISSALTDGHTDTDIRRFMSERVADVLVRMLRSRHGRFDFAEHTDPQYITGQRFEVDEVLRGVEIRVREWAEIEEIIPIDDTVVQMMPDLGERADVTIPAETWRILAALGPGSTVDQVADSTGLSDFVVAKTMAGLVRQGILTAVSTAETARYQEEPSLMEEMRSGGPLFADHSADDVPADDGPADDETDEGGTIEFLHPDSRSGTDGW